MPHSSASNTAISSEAASSCGGGEVNRVAAPQRLTIGKLGGLGDQVVADRDHRQLTEENAELRLGVMVPRATEARC